MKLILVQPQLKRWTTTGDESAHNLAIIQRALEPLAASFNENGSDIVVLPEHWDTRGSTEAYTTSLQALAARLNCHIVGGSYHRRVGDQSTNTGLAISPDGSHVGCYEKLRPYAVERTMVQGGTTLGEFSIAGRQILVLLCADLWFSDLMHQASVLPDLVLVPALSVTRKSTPEYSRAHWKHLATSRAYEFGAFVGISDWGYPSELGILLTSGVGGFADPTELDPKRFFTPIDGDALMVDLDFDALDAFRADRRERGFFWK